MSDRENERFINNPWGYVQNKTINNIRMDWFIWGKKQNPRNIAMRNIAPDFLRFIDTKKLIAVDLKRNPNRANEFLFCPVFKEARHPYGDFAGIHAEKTRFYGKLHAVRREVNNVTLEGYYAPYKHGPVNVREDMGFVDVPRQNPDYNFVFTGSMQGCHLVITECPDDANKFRVWHYQSPGYNPRYTPSQWPGANRTGFPAQHIYDWLSADQRPGLGMHNFYGGNAGDQQEVFAFNFLHWHAGHWWLICQPQKVPDVPNAVIIPGHSKAPFRRQLNLNNPGQFDAWGRRRQLEQRLAARPAPQRRLSASPRPKAAPARWVPRGRGRGKSTPDKQR